MNNILLIQAQRPSPPPTSSAGLTNCTALIKEAAYFGERGAVPMPSYRGC